MHVLQWIGRRFRRGMLYGLLCVLLGGGLLTTTPASAGELGTAKKEMEAGRMYAEYLMRSAPISTDEALNERVTRIGNALVAQLPTTEFPYEFHVIGTGDINACAFPGGYIFVYQGLLEKMPDDNVIAVTLGHEIIHAAHHHQANSEEKLSWVGLLTGLGSIAIGDRDLYLARTITTLTSLHYTRDDEWDADAAGMELAWQAGYDPAGAVELFQLFTALERGDDTPTYLRTHPKATSRLKKAQEECTVLATRQRPTVAAVATPPDVLLTDIVGKLDGITLAPAVYFPLASGNTWTYAVTGQGGQSTYTLKVTGAITVPGGTVFTAETELGNKSVPCQLLTTGHEVWRRSRPTLATSPWRFEHQLDLPDGQAVTHDVYTYTLVGQESLELACGVFPNALHLRKVGQDPVDVTDLWYAPEVGLLRRSATQSGVTETLLSYQVSPIR